MMNSASARSNHNRRCAILLGRGSCCCCLLLIATASSPQQYYVSSFSTPRSSSRPGRSLVPRVLCSEQRSSRIAAAAASARMSQSQSSSAVAVTTKTRTQLKAGRLAYLDSLNDIASNPDLFPTTSSYISQLEASDDASASAASLLPSAEEFLTQLSTELLRASQKSNVVAVGTTPPPSSNTDTTISPLNNNNNFFAESFAETMAPAFASVAAVGAAAGTYNPASYSAHLSTPMKMMAGVASSSRNDYYDYYASSATEAAANAPVVVGNDAASAVESFAAWHTTTRGGSNALRDLASTIPNMEDVQMMQQQQQDGRYAASPGTVGYAAHDAANGAADYFGRQIQEVVAPSLMQDNANTYDSSNLEFGHTWHSQGGSNALQDLASFVPTDSEQQVDASFKDDVLDGVKKYVEQFADGASSYTAAVSSVESQVGKAAVENSEVVTMGGAQLPGVQDVMMSDVATASVDNGLDAPSNAVAAMGDSGLDAASTAAMTYMDTSTMDAGTAATSVTDQASIIPEVNDQLTNSLSSPQLSHLNYDGLQIDDTLAAASTTNAPVVSDFFKSKLESLGLPQYHIELPKSITTATNPFSDLEPSVHNALSSVKEATGSSKEKLDGLLNTMTHTLDGLGDKLPQYHIELPKSITTATNPFSDLEPSVHNALSSVKEASGSSREKLDGLLNTMTHTLDGLGDKVADASNSFESFSGQMSNIAESGVSNVKAIGNAVQSGASAVGDGMSGVRSSIKSVGDGMVRVASSVKSATPNLNIPSPTLPDNAKIQMPDLNLPNVNLPKPTLPEIHGPTLPSVSLPHPNLPNVGDASLADFGNAVLSAIKFTGSILLKFIDWILNAVSGTSVESILSNVQTSISSTIDNASHAVTSTISNIGNMSVKEIIQHSMALVIAITDILLKVMNAIVYVVSGKDGAGWALQATNSVNDAVNGASSQLLAQTKYTTTTYDDVTHVSLAELAHSIGDYGQHVGHEFVTLIGSLDGIGLTLDGVTIPGDTLDSVATAVQTALSL